MNYKLKNKKNQEKIRKEEKNMSKKENVLNENETVKENEKKLVVVRETFVGNDDKEYYSYNVPGKVRNRDVKVDLIPKDKGGYEVLDLIFDISETAELIVRKEQMTDENGVVTNYDAYDVMNVDENGIAFVCGVKPSRASDKSILNILIALNEIDSQKESKEEKRENK